jgi:WD40 repeat protein
MERAGSLSCADLHSGAVFLLAGAQGGQVCIFATSTGDVVKVSRLAPQSSLARSGSNCRRLLQRHDPASIVLVRVLQTLTDPTKAPSPVTCVAWSEMAGAECVVAGYRDGSVRAWDPDSGAGALVT